MRKQPKNLRNNELGATAIEYGLIIALLGLGITASLTSVKDALNSKFNSAGSTLNSAS